LSANPITAEELYTEVWTAMTLVRAKINRVRDKL
jgi:hypothetical protein